MIKLKVMEIQKVSKIKRLAVILVAILLIAVFAAIFYFYQYRAKKEAPSGGNEQRQENVIKNLTAPPDAKSGSVPPAVLDKLSAPKK